MLTYTVGGVVENRILSSLVLCWQGVINSELRTMFAVSNVSKVAWLTTINKAPKHKNKETHMYMLCETFPPIHQLKIQFRGFFVIIHLI